MLPLQEYRFDAWLENCFPGGSDSKASACSMGDPDLIPGSGRSPGEGNVNPLQYSCLENSLDGGAWWPTVHGVTKSWTQLSDFTFFHFGGLRSHMPPSQKKKNFPGSSGVKTPYSHCRGWRFSLVRERRFSLVRELRFHMACMVEPDRKKKKETKDPLPTRNLKTKLSKTILGASLVAEQ